MRILAALFFVVSLSAENSQELDLLRGIAAAPEATMDDVCTIVVIQRGELDKHADAASRCKAINDQKIYRFSAEDIPLLMPATAGAATKAAIYAHGLEETLLFALTGLEWYAVQAAEHLGLVKAKTAHNKKLSGAELLAIFEIALEQAEAKAAWRNPKNPYEVFGVKSYEELNQAYDKMTESGEAPEKKKK
ncbi:MAG: hypothetical protein U1F27_07450 [Turneriella sp.]